ncbi:hypothetical protein A9Q83_11275 [Alphaproteobacteria bacterium 46_93_T64]|nr:hypothetical protein A9Q83_11275 [Alphaproteobacteria bacterium 46_93_T64]
MYIKVLSALTATFLGVLFIVMVGTMPTSVALNVDSELSHIFKINCLIEEMSSHSDSRHI